ncbi:MAG TPA: lysine--tRNA ligase [Streptosporangiaceae bacterium]
MAAANDDWVARTAAEVIALAQERYPGERPTCASGISPSGNVHLGNLRELMTPHLVADEILRMGRPCRHTLSWDDYDRFRRVPQGLGLPEEFSEHVGRPLTSVPDPVGDCHPNWAEHFKAPLKEALDKLGVQVTEISQTQMYTSGAYTEQIITAMRRRAEIGAVIRRYQTKKTEVDEEERQADYFPFKPYCDTCGRDNTTVTAFDDDTTDISYTCACDDNSKIHGPAPISAVHGKLVWKVDWPMRWAYEHVTFEAAGVDHSSPGSSYSVGQHLVEEIFGGKMPLHFQYSFVGTSGQAKMSSSTGGAPTPLDALEIFEPPLLRWLYARKRPSESITLAFGDEVGRVYDEWDALTRKVADGTAPAAQAAIYTRSATTAEGKLPQTERPLPFRTLASVSDITAGDEEQELRILRDLTPETPVATLNEVRPRLDCAQAWVTEYVAPEDRTRVREEPDTGLLAGVADQESQALKLLAEEMGKDWSLDGLTTLLYGIPKLTRGLPISAPPTPEIKAAQRAWFILLYRLLISKDTGPRLPTLLLALGQEKVRQLLS